MPSKFMRMSLRLPLDIYRFLKEEAELERLSLHGMVIRMLDESMKRRQEIRRA